MHPTRGNETLVRRLAPRGSDVAAPVTGSAKAQKAIVVSISQQMLWAYKGEKVVLNSYVSTGRADFDTPIGSFAVTQAPVADDGGRHWWGVLQRARCPLGALFHQ